VWHQRLEISSGVTQVLSSLDGQYLTPFRVMVAVAVTGGCVTVLVHISKVWRCRSSQSLPMLPALLELLPFLCFFSSSLVLCAYSSVAFPHLPVYTMILMTSVFVEIVTHVMVMTVCGGRVQPLHRVQAWMMVFIAGNTVLTYMKHDMLNNKESRLGILPVNEMVLIPVATWISLAHTSWTILQICSESAETLEIYIFRIGKRKKKM